MKKNFFLDFYNKITLWGSLGNKLMGKKQIWAKKYFWGVMGPPPKKISDICRVSPEFLNSKSLEPHVRPRHIVWVLE